MADMEEIAASLNALLTNYGATRDQMADLLGGSGDGGPNFDGNYPVTTAAGLTFLVPCPRRLAALSGDTASAVAAIQPILDAARIEKDQALAAALRAEVAASSAATSAGDVNVVAVGADIRSSASKIAIVAADLLLNAASKIAAVAGDLALGAASKIGNALGYAQRAETASAAAAVSAGLGPKLSRFVSVSYRSTTDGVLRIMDKRGNVFARFSPSFGWSLYLAPNTVQAASLSFNLARSAVLARSTGGRYRYESSGTQRWMDRRGNVFAMFESTGRFRFSPAAGTIGENAFGTAGKRDVAGIAGGYAPGVWGTRIDSQTPAPPFSRIYRTLGDGEQWVSNGMSNDTDPTQVGSVLHFVSTRAGAGSAAFNPPIAAESASRRAYRVAANAPDTSRNVIREYLSTTPTTARRKIYVILGIGQSNQAGQQPTLTTEARRPGMVMMPNGGVRMGVSTVSDVANPSTYDYLADAVCVGTETADVATAYRLAENDGIRCVVLNTGIPNASYDELKEGTPPFENGIKAIARFFGILNEIGVDVEVIVTVRHGERDQGDRLGLYYQKAVEWIAAYRRRIGQVTGQRSVAFFFAPPVGVSGSYTPVDMERICRDDPLAFWVSSANVAEMLDYQHWSAAGQRVIGDAHWYFPIREYMLTGTVDEFMPVSLIATRNGQVITIPMKGASLGMEFDSSADVPEAADGGKGVTYSHPTGSFTVQTVAFNGQSVTVTLSANPGAIVAGERVRLAFLGGNFPEPDVRNRPHTNIRAKRSETRISRIDGRVVLPRLGPSELTIVAA